MNSYNKFSGIGANFYAHKKTSCNTSTNSRLSKKIYKTIVKGVNFSSISELGGFAITDELMNLNGLPPDHIESCRESTDNISANNNFSKRIVPRNLLSMKICKLSEEEIEITFNPNNKVIKKISKNFSISDYKHEKIGYIRLSHFNSSTDKQVFPCNSNIRVTRSESPCR
jgi:hypothetical protein